ncbi:mechanosensitive ion channel family protein [Thermodesulfobacterium hydrogeniphilum]|uniref:mechanosensitive ion channel family protein n=1 Tax=Thermodesulfobacterium hydrogeniphilum TaxID=161156 RepID=UPI000ABE5CE2|nr:mechanosensitive ion channel domain-containing protein [Thermodesulfobacterium hydrogeniphilum]
MEIINKNLLYGIGVLVISIIAAIVLHTILYFLLKKITLKTKSKTDDLIIKYSRGPALVIFIIGILLLVIPFVPFSEEVKSVFRHIVVLILICDIAWLFIAGAYFLEKLILTRYPMDTPDNLKARKIYTQVVVLKRIIIVISIFFAFSLSLLTFPKVKQIGMSLLASAGVVGVILGIAAQKTLANIIAGIQLAITQPIRIDDVVIVEGEWGRIEEITLTYVVVRVWDKRRLIVPVNYFLERPFQNWTRVSADLLATVYIYADYHLPVDPVRKALYEILKESNNWDGKVWGLQVTDLTDKTMELRALMSASDSSKAWDLRCEVREKLINFIQKQFPHCLPKIRAELENKKIIKGGNV